MSNQERPRDEGKGDESWRVQALNLGVDPDEPDDSTYWRQLDRAKGIIETFRYHQPDVEQVARIAAIRQGAINFAQVILRSTIVSADQTAALRMVHEAMMTSNKAIVNE